MTDIPEDLVITINDLRPGICVPGARRWFEANGLDFRDFLANGMNARQLATYDALSARVVADRIARG